MDVVLGGGAALLSGLDDAGIVLCIVPPTNLTRLAKLWQHLRRARGGLVPGLSIGGGGGDRGGGVGSGGGGGDGLALNAGAFIGVGRPGIGTDGSCRIDNCPTNVRRRKKEENANVSVSPDAQI